MEKKRGKKKREDASYREGRNAMRLVASTSEGLAGIASLSTELLLDTKKLVVLGKTLRAARSTSLDLTAAKTNDKISDEGILSLTRAVGNHDTPASSAGIKAGLDSLRHGTDLVDLKKKSVAGLLLLGHGDTLGVGHKEIITDDLELLADDSLELGVGLPVVLIEGILDGPDGILSNPLLVDLDELVTSDLKTVLLLLLGDLLAKVVLLGLLVEELRSSDIHGDLDLAGVASLGDSLNDELETSLVLEDVGSEATLITDVGGILTELLLDDELEVLVDLSGHAHSLSEALGASGADHELLHGKTVASVATTVDNVEARKRKHELLVARELSNIAVEGKTLEGGGGTADAHGDTEDGVGTELALVGGTVDINHHLIDLSLLGDIHADELGGEDGVDVVNSLENTLAHVDGLIAITKLTSLIDTSGGTRGDTRAEEALLSLQVNLNSGVAAGIVDLTSVNRKNLRHD